MCNIWVCLFVLIKPLEGETSANEDTHLLHTCLILHLDDTAYHSCTEKKGFSRVQIFYCKNEFDNVPSKGIFTKME